MRTRSPSFVTAIPPAEVWRQGRPEVRGDPEEASRGIAPSSTPAASEFAQCSQFVGGRLAQLTLPEIAQLDWPERGAVQLHHSRPQCLDHAANLPVPALAEPDLEKFTGTENPRPSRGHGPAVQPNAAVGEAGNLLVSSLGLVATR